MTIAGKPPSEGYSIVVRRPRRWPLLLLLLAAGTVLGWLASVPQAGPLLVAGSSRVLGWRPASYEQWARAEFERRWPGERPVNWAIAEAAVDLSRRQAMGRFKLALEAGEWGNDCSDFVACAVDAGLGVRSRLELGTRHHAYGEDPRLFSAHLWRPGMTVQPGDLVSVRHSPWYTPSDSACWHIGVVGVDGRVYDFTKLRRWNRPRYGRHELAWFVRHSPTPGEVILGRLKPQYRFRVEPLPPPRNRVD